MSGVGLDMGAFGVVEKMFILRYVVLEVLCSVQRAQQMTLDILAGKCQCLSFTCCLCGMFG